MSLNQQPDHILVALYERWEAMVTNPRNYSGAVGRTACRVGMEEIAEELARRGRPLKTK